MLVFRKDDNREENYKTEQELINSKKHTDKGDKSEGDYFGLNGESNEPNTIIHIWIC